MRRFAFLILATAITTAAGSEAAAGLLAGGPFPTDDPAELAHYSGLAGTPADGEVLLTVVDDYGLTTMPIDDEPDDFEGRLPLILPGGPESQGTLNDGLPVDLPVDPISSGGLTSSVPEPSAAMLAALTAFTLGLGNRRSAYRL